MLIIPLPVSAQTSEPYTDPCDKLPLRDWPNSRNVQVQNGVCALQNGNLGSEQPLDDFVVRFKVSMDANARLVFSYGTSMNDQYEFVITPTGASLVNYIRFGNASNTVNDKLLAKASLHIASGQWYRWNWYAGQTAVAGNRRQDGHRSRDGSFPWGGDYRNEWGLSGRYPIGAERSLGERTAAARSARGYRPDMDRVPEQSNRPGNNPPRWERNEGACQPSRG